MKSTHSRRLFLCLAAVSPALIADEALELHLHGYNIHVVATPEHPASMSFKAHTVGRFPIAAHIFKHPILTHLEIFPR